MNWRLRLAEVGWFMLMNCGGFIKGKDRQALRRTWRDRLDKQIEYWDAFEDGWE